MKNNVEAGTELKNKEEALKRDASDAEKDEEFFEMIRGEYKKPFQNLFNREFGRRFKEMKENKEELDYIKKSLVPLYELYKEEDVAKIVERILDEKSTDASKSEKSDVRYDGWMNEAMETAGKYPGFDLTKELENPEFRAGLMSGIPMEKLYRGIHFDELAKFISQAAAKATVENIRAGHGRISEVGSEASPSVKAKKDVASLTDGEIEEFLKKIKRGEKITF